MWKLEGITYWNDAVADVLNEMYDITLEILQKRDNRPPVPPFLKNAFLQYLYYVNQ